jgi:flagellar hook-associated protein 2
LVDSFGGQGATFDNLVELGITTDSSGKLSLDSDVLDEALTSDFAGVVSLVNAAGTELEDTISAFLEDGGIIEARTDGISARLDDINDQRIELDERLARIEDRLVKQFTALDTLLGQLQTTSTFLTSQLAAVPVPGQDK